MLSAVLSMAQKTDDGETLTVQHRDTSVAISVSFTDVLVDSTVTYFDTIIELRDTQLIDPVDGSSTDSIIIDTLLDPLDSNVIVLYDRYEQYVDWLTNEKLSRQTIIDQANEEQRAASRVIRWINREIQNPRRKINKTPDDLLLEHEFYQQINDKLEANERLDDIPGFTKKKMGEVIEILMNRQNE